MKGVLFRYPFSFAYKIICYLSLGFLLNGCSTADETINKLSLSLESANCAEVCLKLSVNNISLPADVVIQKNGNDFIKFFLTQNDTLIFDTLVKPKAHYTYSAYCGSDKSSQVNAFTPDTTSHNFTWKMEQLGDFSGVLYDAAIINDTLAYAVGEVYKKDSAGGWDPQAYNAVKWNGKDFIPFRIELDEKVVSIKYPPFRAICAFSADKIIISTGGVAALFDGEKATTDFRINPLLNGVINRICGKSPNDFYVVGELGTIVHFYNGNWQKIESGTKLDLFDIYSLDGKDFWIAGGSFENNTGILLKGSGSVFNIQAEGRFMPKEQIFKPYFAGIAKTIWISSSNTIYFGGHLLQKMNSGQMSLVKSLPGNDIGLNGDSRYQGFISQMRGNNDNDLLMIGERNTIRHFNGITWQQIGLPFDPDSGYMWLTVAMKNNTAVVAGRSYSRAIIMVLTRK